MRKLGWGPGPALSAGRISVVEPPVPGGEPLQPDLDRGAGAETHRRLQGADVGHGGLDVAVLHRQQFQLGALPEAVLEGTDEAEQFYRLVVADVVYAKGGVAGGRVGAVPVPFGVRLGRLSREQADYLGVPVEGPYKPEYYRY